MQEVEVTKLLNNGFGMARGNDGRLIMIPESLPGEAFRVDDTRRRQGVLWMVAGKRLSCSKDRCAPRCPHFGLCGGCQLLFIRPECELTHKCDMLRDTLQRIGKMGDVAFEVHDATIDESRYRGRFRAHPNGTVGFLHRRSADITPVPHCVVIPKSVACIVDLLGQGTEKKRFAGSIFFVCEPETDTVVLGIQGGREAAGFFEWTKTHLQNRVEGVCLMQASGRIRENWGKKEISIRWNGIRIGLRPAQFFQSNPNTWPHFFDRMKRFLSANQLQSIWDVHAGSGFLASCCSGVNCLATEPDRVANRQLRRLAKMRSEVSVLPGRAESVLEDSADVLRQVDGIVLDPPRQGLSHRLRQWLCETGPRHILYFSCDMATLARDLAVLASRYAVVGPVTVINTNPGTVRVETVVELLRDR